MKEVTMELVETMERLMEAVEKLEGTMTVQKDFSAAAEERVARIVATVESEREMELVRRLEEAEAKIAELSAAAASTAAAAATATAGRKTSVAGVESMVAKHGIAVENLQAGSIDAALVGLSVEQRIAVKAELLRSGLIG